MKHGGHRCKFCLKSFGRPDVLRRHYERCPLRKTRPIPQKLKPGRRKHACDQCMRSKLACDAETPCDTCLFHARECTREAQQHNLGRTELTPLSKSLPSHDLNLLWLERVTSAPKPELVFDFLLKYTLPSTWSLPGSLGIDIDNKANIGRVSHFCGEPIADESHGETSAYDTGLPFGLDGTRLFASTPGTLTPIQQPFEISAALLSVPETPPMSLYEHIAHGIIDELICFTTQRGTCQLGAVDSLYRFLLSGNLQDHLANYFTRWHRHSPTIHRPSFRLVDTPPSLLLAILLIGASLSSIVEVRSTVDQVVDLAEDYVFDHGHFQDLLSSESKVLCPKQGLHAIQAAHCIVQLQLRSPCNEKRVSIRQERYRQLIDSIQHYNAAHGSSNEACEIDNDTNKAPSWRDFGLVEARKRLTYGIFTIEATFSVFYDLPPRLKLEDLDVGLPCSVEEFMTSSQMRYSLQNELHRPVERLHEILTILFSEQTNFSTLHFYHFDVLQLFILILAVLQEMWTLSKSRFRQCSGAYAIALKRWKKLWDLTNSSTMHTLFEDMHGFYKTAAIEFWQLAMLLLQNGVSRISQMGGLHAFLAQNLKPGRNHTG